MNNKLSDFGQFVSELSGDAELARAVDKELEETTLVDKFVSLRHSAKLSQRDLAKRMGVSASTVCRIETSTDSELTIGEIESYLKGIELPVQLYIHLGIKVSASDRIKNLVISIHEELAKLSNLAKASNEDEALINAINKFRSEVLFNLMISFDKTQRDIPVKKTISFPATTTGKKAGKNKISSLFIPMKSSASLLETSEV